MSSKVKFINRREAEKKIKACEKEIHAVLKKHGIQISVFDHPAGAIITLINDFEEKGLINELELKFNF